jgi:hypothetical protein
VSGNTLIVRERDGSIEFDDNLHGKYADFTLDRDGAVALRKALDEYLESHRNTAPSSSGIGTDD